MKKKLIVTGFILSSVVLLSSRELVESTRQFIDPDPVYQYLSPQESMKTMVLPEGYRIELVDHPFLLIEGALQNQDNVISVKASHVQPLSFKVAAAVSHDFH